MLHTKPQGHWPFDSGEEDFWRVFTIYGRGGHLGHITQTPRTNFRSPIPLKLHMKFGFDRPSGFGEDLWKSWTTDPRTDDRPWLYYKLTNEPKSSGELKIHWIHVTRTSRPWMTYSKARVWLVNSSYRDSLRVPRWFWNALTQSVVKKLDNIRLTKFLGAYICLKNWSKCLEGHEYPRRRHFLMYTNNLSLWQW